MKQYDHSMDALSYALLIPPVRRLNPLQRLLRWLDQRWCALQLHHRPDDLLIEATDDKVLRLHCQHCGYRTRGWRVP